jgi:hypothetical protein
MKKITFSLSVACLFAATTIVSAQRAETDVPNPNAVVNNNQMAPSTGTYINEGGVLYDNGPFITEVGPPNISLLQNSTLGLTLLGTGASTATGFSVADQAILPNAVNINTVSLYAYQTGAPTSPSPIIGVFLQVWDGDPSDPGSNVVYGDLTTDRFDGSIWFDTYRESETSPGTSRAIMIVNAATPGLTLDAGTYWFHWAFEGDAGFSGPWNPPVTILGQTDTGDALQLDGNTNTWGPVASGASDEFPQGLPFQLLGTEVLSVGELSLNNQVAIYPNPADKQITIANNSNINVTEANIYNLQGKLVQSIALGNKETIVDISTMASGVYMVKISSDSGTTTKKLIKR